MLWFPVFSQATRAPGKEIRTRGPRSIFPLSVFSCQAERGRQSPSRAGSDWTKYYRGRRREKPHLGVLALRLFRQRPLLWLGHWHDLASPYCFIGGRCGHICFIRGEPGILYLLVEGHENIQEGKVIVWGLRLSRYLISMEKNSRGSATRLSAGGPLSWVAWLPVSEQVQGKERLYSYSSQISDISGVWAHSTSPVLMPVWWHSPLALHVSREI